MGTLGVRHRVGDTTSAASRWNSTPIGTSYKQLQIQGTTPRSVRNWETGSPEKVWTLFPDSQHLVHTGTQYSEHTCRTGLLETRRPDLSPAEAGVLAGSQTCGDLYTATGTETPGTLPVNQEDDTLALSGYRVSIHVLPPYSFSRSYYRLSSTERRYTRDEETTGV